MMSGVDASMSGATVTTLTMLLSLIESPKMVSIGSDAGRKRDALCAPALD
jgi:hypothetical protein